MNQYLALKQRQQKEHADFPMFFAFSDERFFEGMKRLGLEETDTDKVAIVGGGGYCREEDIDKLRNMGAKHRTELEQALKGEQFAEQALEYELANHEYNYTLDVTDALRALGLTEVEVKNSPMLSRALRKAKSRQGEPF